MADEGSEQLRVVVFPWLAFGHMLPFLEFSKSLARRGHHISFISTPGNIQRLPKVPPEIAHLISFIPFHLPRTEGLREAAEATTDLPPEEVPFLKKAFDGLEHPFSQFVERASPKPDWIIQDFVQHWMPSIASDVGIPCIFYVPFAVAAQVFYGPTAAVSSRLTLEMLTVPPPWVTFPSKVAYRLHEAHKLRDHLTLLNPSGIGDVQRYKMVIEGCKAVVVRSCMELESEYLSLAETIFKKPVIPAGLLPPSANERNENVNETENEIVDWLDRQSSGSVVYVALGTEAAMSTGLLHELALGLEAAEVPFIWALRRPFGLGEDVDMLPPAFLDRTKGLGMVVMGWVPQVKVLAHGAVGGFLTHCGWSSIIEGLQAGHPLVLLPIALDQGLNARLMEEKGIGVEVERNEDGSFTRDDVSKALRSVMVDDEGEQYRKKAREMMEIVTEEERQAKYVEDFIQYLVSHRGNQKIESQLAI